MMWKKKEEQYFVWRNRSHRINLLYFHSSRNQTKWYDFRKIYQRLGKETSVDYDISGSIGKRYRRQDEIGTPTCITIDSQTLEDGTVTTRARDTMEQTRVHVDMAFDEGWEGIVAVSENGGEKYIRLKSLLLNYFFARRPAPHQFIHKKQLTRNHSTELNE